MKHEVMEVVVDLTGLTTHEARQEVIRAKLREALPEGMRVLHVGYNHTPDRSQVKCTCELEPREFDPGKLTAAS